MKGNNCELHIKRLEGDQIHIHSQLQRLITRISHGWGQTTLVCGSKGFTKDTFGYRSRGWSIWYSVVVICGRLSWVSIEERATHSGTDRPAFSQPCIPVQSTSLLLIIECVSSCALAEISNGSPNVGRTQLVHLHNKALDTYQMALPEKSLAQLLCECCGFVLLLPLLPWSKSLSRLLINSFRTHLRQRWYKATITIDLYYKNAMPLLGVQHLKATTKRHPRNWYQCLDLFSSHSFPSVRVQSLSTQPPPTPQG